MFSEGPIEGVILRPAICIQDARGWILELFRQDDLPAELMPKMAYVSETLPGVTRGPHAHRQQTDYFAFFGPGDFTLYLWDSRERSSTRGHHQKLVVGESNKLGVVVPPGVVHAYQNISDRPAWSFNCPNQLYAGAGRKSPVDEIRYENIPGHPYLLDELE